MTNYEKIKNMDVIEMATFLSGCTACDYCIHQNEGHICKYTNCLWEIKKWLESEVINEGTKMGI